MTTEKRDLRTGRTPWPSPRQPQARKLWRDHRTEVLVIGAGISGAFMAEALSLDHQVTVIDRRGIARGSTAASTALIAAEIDVPLTRLKRKIGREKAIRVWRRASLAVAAIAARADFLGLTASAGLARRDSLYLSGNILDADALRSEGAERRAAGLSAEFLSRGDLRQRCGVRHEAGLLAFGNFIADPVRLAAGHLAAAAARGAHIHAPVEAAAIETAANGVMVATAGGPVIEAKKVIFCTGYELPDFVATARGEVVSTYAFATAPQPRRLWPTRCMIWEASDPYLYMRDTPDGRVVCGGEDEPFADEAARDALIGEKVAELRRKLARILPGIATEPDRVWAGSFGESDTGLPLIGRVPGRANCFAVLGFGGNGTTYSRIAADLIRAELAGEPDVDADLFAFRSARSSGKRAPRSSRR